MTDDKVLAVVDRYEHLLLDDPARMRGLLFGPNEYEHTAFMLKEIVRFIREGHRERAMRWLGFVQGVFWVRAVYAIREMADHNRPANEEPSDGA